jgi:hypothetical protein
MKGKMLNLRMKSMLFFMFWHLEGYYCLHQEHYAASKWLMPIQGEDAKLAAHSTLLVMPKFGCQLWLDD